MEKLIVIDHPIAHHKLSILRDKNTEPKQFRRLMEELSQLLAYDVTRDTKVVEVDVETPMATFRGSRVSEKIALISIMRAGNGMLEGMMKLLSYASVGHVGIYRDKFINNTVEYYFRVPSDIQERDVILLDPLLATGDTASAAISRLKEYGVKGIKFVTILASKQGIDKIRKEYPDVQIYTMSVEPEMTAEGYLLPGIGDAGDRLYGTVTDS